MWSPFIEIAASKAAAAERSMLEQILSLAIRLDELEASFESKINASKASRGESPTRLSKSEREELQHLAEDEKDLESELLVEYRKMRDASDIVASLHADSELDVSFWRDNRGHAHPDDRPILGELVEAKADLSEAMARFLERYPATGG